MIVDRTPFTMVHLLLFPRLNDSQKAVQTLKLYVIRGVGYVCEKRDGGLGGKSSNSFVCKLSFVIGFFWVRNNRLRNGNIKMV